MGLLAVDWIVVGKTGLTKGPLRFIVELCLFGFIGGAFSMELSLLDILILGKYELSIGSAMAWLKEGIPTEALLAKIFLSEDDTAWEKDSCTGLLLISTKVKNWIWI